MKTKILFLLTVLLLNVATATSGQASPKTDRQAVQNPASNKQRPAWTKNFSLLKREKPRLLFLPRNAGVKKFSPLRAAQATPLLLDSTVARMNPALFENNETGGKIAYQYNTAGQVILEIDYEWNAATQAWEETRRRGYDSNGRLTLEIENYYSIHRDEETGEYVEYEVRYKYECAYDSLNWQTLSAYYRWENGQWIGKQSKSVIEYADRTGQYDVIESEYIWYNDGWLIYRKEEFTCSGQRQFLAGNSDTGPVPEQAIFNMPQPYRESGASPGDSMPVYACYDYNEDGTWNYARKTERTKDKHGNVTEQIDYYWDRDGETGEGSWEIIKCRRNYTYNAEGWIIACAEEYYSEETNNTWQPDNYASYAIVYTYDSAGNIAGCTKTRANGEPAGKSDYVYDDHNRIKKETRYNMDPEDYRYESKNEYAYDLYGNVKSNIFFRWENGAWQSIRKYERTLDASGKVTMYAESEWYEGVWRYSQKEEHAYDVDGRVTMHSYIVYYGLPPSSGHNGTSGYRDEYACDDNGNETLHIYYRYDDATQTFIPESKSENTYGSISVNMGEDGDMYNPLTVKEYEWDVQSNSWIAKMEEKYEWQFDASNNPLAASASLKNGDQWIWYGTMTWYYSLHKVSGLKTVTNDGLRIYPSPAKGELFIQSAQPVADATVFNLAGVPVVRCKLSGGQSVDISHLPAGVYIVRAGGYTGKFVKE